MHEEFNWNKLKNIGWGLVEFVFGYCYSVRSADSPNGSNTNNDEAVRGRIIFGQGIDDISKGWDESYKIWVPNRVYPNHDENTIIINVNHSIFSE